MPTIRVSVPHKLTQDEALKRVRKAIDAAKKQHPEKVPDLKETWDGYEGSFSGSAMGNSLAGTLAVEPDEVTVEGKLPLLAMPFKGKIESAIQDTLKRLLA